MVRLKVTESNTSETVYIISIPVWYDWKQASCTRNWVYSLISIPVWYDWKIGVELASLESWHISIPVWYDWKEEKPGVTLFILSFQFQYGTIERFLVIRKSPCLYLFQFQYGTIESSIILIASSDDTSFQFQYGTIERRNLSDYWGGPS